MSNESKWTEKRHRLVTAKRATRLKAFTAALADLCDKFKVDLDSDGGIEVIERGFKYPDGYSFSADFDGVDERGARSFRVEYWWGEDVEVKGKE